jgi:hypothetical protein
MAKLPGNAELKKLFILGVPQKEIAEHYGTTIQAVNLRFHNLGLHRTPYARQAGRLINSIWPERRGREHHGRTAELLFRSYLRRRLGDRQLSGRQELQAAAFSKRVTGSGVVLSYDITSADGWMFVPRVDGDGDWVIRRPEEWVAPAGVDYGALLLTR